jgi:hypothetical protein
MLSTFLARYDAQLLQPPALPAGPASSAGPAALPPPEREVQQRLLAWCCHAQAAGRPALSIALLTGAPAGSRCALVEDAALQLDGTHALLAAGGRWRQRLFRLRVKARECLGPRPRGPDAALHAVWDSGYLIDSTQALARLPHFQPRRPTLVVAQGLTDAALREAVRTLVARQPAFAQPVRLLVLAPSAPAALAAMSTADGASFSRGALSFQALRPAPA